MDTRRERAAAGEIAGAAGARPDDSAAVFERAKALFLEGLAALGARRLADAERCFEGSLALLPDRVSTRVNLAATQLALGRPQDALANADRVLAAEPDHADGWLHRATALEATGRYAEALEGFDRALAAQPRVAEIAMRRGRTLERLNRNEEALAAHDRALALDPAHAEAWSRRGGLLREAGRLGEAARAFEQARAHGAEPGLTEYYLAAVGAGAPPAAAPARYVQALFDDYAGDFDDHLLRVLGYRAPAVIASRVGALVAPRVDALGAARPAFRSALDLGCGTGLCGPLLRPLAERLVGVDLSHAMLERARARGVYDRLDLAEITAHLDASEETHDLVVAADVFIYLGDLAPVFAAVRRRVRDGAVFAFSVERASRESGEFELLPSLRYAHSARHLRALAVRAGFECVELFDAPIREDRRTAVDALFVVLRA